MGCLALKVEDRGLLVQGCGVRVEAFWFVSGPHRGLCKKLRPEIRSKCLLMQCLCIEPFSTEIDGRICAAHCVQLWIPCPFNIAGGKQLRRYFRCQTTPPAEGDFFIDNLLVRIHYIIVAMR